MTAVAEPQAAEPAEVTPATPPPTRGPRRRWLLVGTIVVWVLISWIFQGRATKAIGGADQVGVQQWLADRAKDLIEHPDNPIRRFTLGFVGENVDAVIIWLQRMLSTPDFPSPYPAVGFLGALAIAWFLTALWAGWKLSLLTAASFIAFALLGYYRESMDLLIVTLFAVLVSVIVGLPLAVWMAHSSRARAAITPVLDLLQTLPAFTYLLPLMLFFGIGAAAAVVCTVIYSLPPVMRIAAHGLRQLPESTIEASTSMGLTFWQRLSKVELPMAKATVIVGINQTTMAALSMATIAAFINGPGLGQPVVRALNALRVGDAFVPGICIVIMAIMLDRVTTAASQHSERLARGQGRETATRRVRMLASAGAVTVIVIYLSRFYDFAARPWTSPLGDHIASWAQSVVDYVQTNWTEQTQNLSEGFTNALINPLQSVIAGSPWFVTAAALCVLAYLLGSWQALLATVVCLAGIYGLGLWNNAMITLTTVLVAAVFVMVLASTVGVWMGRSTRADTVIRPILDAGQTLPPFVYLIPVLALFGPTRFTAIVAAVCYAAPPAIKIVADGIRAVAATTIEAAESAGAIAIQIITKVQIPMARSSFTVAANQGLLYVLSMVVIGGLVGAGALGYDVVAGFKQLSLQGRGLAAGFSIVLIGVMLDRITTYAARRSEGRAR